MEFLDKNRTAGATINVSRNGVCLASSTPRAVNGLVRLKLFLPPNEDPIEIFGKVAWQGVTRSEAGIGIHFLEIESRDRDRWVEFVSQVERLNAGDTASTPSSAQESPVVERRASPRTTASFMVRFRSRKRLDEFVSQNLSAGGMFLSTPVLRPEGEKVSVVIIHPISGKDFSIDAEVVRANRTATENEMKGMALKFLNLDDEKQTELEAFLKG